MARALTYDSKPFHILFTLSYYLPLIFKYVLMEKFKSFRRDGGNNFTYHNTERSAFLKELDVTNMKQLTQALLATSIGDICYVGTSASSYKTTGLLPRLNRREFL